MLLLVNRFHWVRIAELSYSSEKLKITIPHLYLIRFKKKIHFASLKALGLITRLVVEG